MSAANGKTDSCPTVCREEQTCEPGQRQTAFKRRQHRTNNQGEAALEVFSELQYRDRSKRKLRSCSASGAGAIACPSMNYSKLTDRNPDSSTISRVSRRSVAARMSRSQQRLQSDWMTSLPKLPCLLRSISAPFANWFGLFCGRSSGYHSTYGPASAIVGIALQLSFGTSLGLVLHRWRGALLRQAVPSARFRSPSRAVEAKELLLPSRAKPARAESTESDEQAKHSSQGLLLRESTRCA